MNFRMQQVTRESFRLQSTISIGISIRILMKVERDADFISEMILNREVWLFSKHFNYLNLFRWYFPNNNLWKLFDLFDIPSTIHKGSVLTWIRLIKFYSFLPKYLFYRFSQIFLWIWLRFEEISIHSKYIMTIPWTKKDVQNQRESVMHIYINKVF